MAGRSVHLSIPGRVQGVGYRAWFEREAVKLSLAGWVRNRRDGSVEAVISGDAEAVDALIDRARTGPVAARVDAVEVTDGQPTPGADFEVRATA